MACNSLYIYHFLYENFDTLSADSIKKTILNLSSYQNDLYLKVIRIQNNKNAFIGIKDIASFKTMFSDQVTYL